MKNIIQVLFILISTMDLIVRVFFVFILLLSATLHGCYRLGCRDFKGCTPIFEEVSDNCLWIHVLRLLKCYSIFQCDIKANNTCCCPNNCIWVREIKILSIVLNIEIYLMYQNVYRKFYFVDCFLQLEDFAVCAFSEEMNCH